MQPPISQQPSIGTIIADYSLTLICTLTGTLTLVMLRYSTTTPYLAIPVPLHPLGWGTAAAPDGTIENSSTQ